jgi:hypothetical protein
MNPAVVISAYNRPAALLRLLQSVQAATYPGDTPIPLVISIDQAAEHPDVVEIAQAVSWPYGPKRILCQPQHLGPIEHFYTCGNLTHDYEAIVFLEDDLWVSPIYYTYANQALEYYSTDEKIAGLSLYALWFNGYTQQPFVPLTDEADIFFLQVPYTQGLAFTRQQWSGFQSWRGSKAALTQGGQPIHEAWSNFKPDEWFPWFTHYLVSTERYFVFPRVSLTTGFGDAGTHFERATLFFQVPLQRSGRRFSFKPLAESVAVYDSFFELLPERMDRLTSALHGYKSNEYTIDLYATRSRDNIPTPYVLTTRPCQNPLATFGRKMCPMEANLENQVPGRDIFFCKTEDLRWDPWANLEIYQKNAIYFNHGRQMALKAWLKMAFFEVHERIKRKH